MPLIAKYRLTWRGSVVEPGTVIDARIAATCYRNGLTFPRRHRL